MHPVLVEEQPDYLMAAGEARLGKAQGTPGRRRMGRGEQGDGEFHGRSGGWKTAGMIRPDAFFCPPAGRKKPAEAG
ncbi:hypothetical protein FQZ97_1274120 [compost metagenome]